MRYLNKKNTWRSLCGAGAGLVLLSHDSGFAGTLAGQETVSLPAPPPAPDPSEQTVQLLTPPIQIGKASWYGPRFQGKVTASGEVYNQQELTAAHRRLPGGSIVQVTNLENGRSVRVRINDRGPFDGCIIDVSQKAAQALGMLKRGRVPVQLSVLSRPE